jgi:hypothetical protein
MLHIVPDAAHSTYVSSCTRDATCTSCHLVLAHSMLLFVVSESAYCAAGAVCTLDALIMLPVLLVLPIVILTTRCVFVIVLALSCFTCCV